MIGKVVTKFIQSLPSWEVTKYYGRVCMYQIKCLKYKFQTSEAWFNFKCKFMPGSLRNELECEESIEKKVKPQSKQQVKPGTIKSETSFNDVIRNAKRSKKGNKKYQEDDKFTMPEDCIPQKKRKAKRAQ
ncbi:uncharacterized protein LOC108630791 isoform X1 [Ceratina calcarata]|uniref:Uncharacterized protein LOC108630791 isoform X1 n=1 Tax=Ceratina calcarata TaxID=156304 RepID=A0AAJ7NE06_9HYME|nr:uncharacterized protein LOC108630791 isoform X1 [Ceratina calcarata]